MIKEIKKKYLRNNIKTSENEKSNNKYILTKKEKKIQYKGTQIPKLLLNKNISDYYNTKRIYYSHRKINKVSSANYLFLEKPRKNEITNYFYTKNKNLINDISLNSKRKLSNLSTLEGMTQNDINQNKKYKHIKSKIFNMSIKKNIIKNKSETEKNSMNTSFLSSKPEDPFLGIKIKKYLKEKENKRDDLFVLVNNPFSKIQNNKSRLFPHLSRKIILKKLIKPKEIKNDIYDSIMKEYDEAKSLSKDKIERKVERNLLKNKLYRNKNGKKVYPKQILNNSSGIQKQLIEGQVNLIKRKINSNFSEEVNFDFLNDFNTNLYLSLLYPKDEILNRRAHGKLINDCSVIKDLVEESIVEYNKKNNIIII